MVIYFGERIEQSLPYGGGKSEHLRVGWSLTATAPTRVGVGKVPQRLY